MDTPSPYVDIPRYMGDWYVVGSIASFLEKDAYNAVEHYALNSDGSIATTFSYRQGGFNGRPRKIKARGYIKDKRTNSVWGMQFLWPIKADYRIVWIAPDYGRVVIARKKRDYVWLMGRAPQVTEDEYAQMTAFAGSLGYDITRIKRVPQQGRQFKRRDA